jgi:hypothetical protein
MGDWEWRRIHEESAMRRTQWLIAGLALAGAAAAPAAAQRLSEQFIPVGYSPGVSGVSAVIGEVVAVDELRGVMTVEVDGGLQRFVMTPRTSVWLDRSDERMHSLDVGYDGLRIGDRVEVKRGDPEVTAANFGASPASIADWIKIEASARD